MNEDQERGDFEKWQQEARRFSNKKSAGGVLYFYPEVNNMFDGWKARAAKALEEIEKIDRQLECFKKAAIEMFEADHAYGCGFYSDDDWRLAYGKLQRLAGFSKKTSVLGEFDIFENLPNEGACLDNGE